MRRISEVTERSVHAPR